MLVAAVPARGQLGLSGQKTTSKRSESIVYIDGKSYRVHTIARGETLYSLSKLYEVTEEEITAANPLVRGPEGVKGGQVIKIPVHAETTTPTLTARQTAKLFDEYTVKAGDTSYSIARSYGLSLNILVEDNPGVDPTRLPVGAVLQIRKAEQGETHPWKVSEQWRDYRDAANSVSEDFKYHIVRPGETLYSLSRMYGVPSETLVETNNLQEGLKAGGMIRIPSATQAAEDEEKEEQATHETTDFFGDGEGNNRMGSDSHFFRPSGGTPDIALMLPLEGTTSRGNDFTEFYKGALLALEDLKSEGHSLNVRLFDTARSPEKVAEIVSSHHFSDIDLIVGPVYEAEMEHAVEYADGNGVPMVSPLSAVHGLDSRMLYQMAPDPATKYEKLRGLLRAPESNIILVSSGAGDDKEFEREIVAELGIAGGGTGNYGRFTIGGSGDIASLIDWERENVFVVLAGTELTVDRALASISSAYSNASARRGRRAGITVVGSSKWANYNNAIDKNLFFKLNVRFVTSYYIDRSDSATRRFEIRYFEAYGDFPTRAAYRGYDALALFGGALFESGYSFDDRLNAVGEKPLGTPYRFVRSDSGNRRVNDRWTLVGFSDDYDISVQ